VRLIARVYARFIEENKGLKKGKKKNAWDETCRLFGISSSTLASIANSVKETGDFPKRTK
jgi:hypothetical protein